MPECPKGRTALVVVDAKNDFISEGGKAWPALREVCETVGTVSNMKRALDAARAVGLYVMQAPMTTQPWDYKEWRHRNPSQDAMHQGAALSSRHLGQ